MGEVAVLHPQDLFNNPNRPDLISPVMKSNPFSRRNTNSAPTFNRNSVNRRKKSPPKNKLKENNHQTTKPSSSISTNLVMGQVKILKRGEDLPAAVTICTPPPKPKLKPKPKPISTSKDDVVKKQQQQQVYKITPTKKKMAPVDHDYEEFVVLSSKDRLGPEPDMLPKQIRISDCYTGWAFVSSPPPSSLPLPAFSKKKNLVFADVDCNNHSSSNDEATSDLLKLLRLDQS